MLCESVGAWEDTRVDLEALRLTGKSRVLAVSSGGCDVLSYLIRQPQDIVAIHTSTCRLCLTRLKLAAFQYLPSYEDVFSFLGYGSPRANLINYRRYIRARLDESTRAFWDSPIDVPGEAGRQRIRYFVDGARGIVADLRVWPEAATHRIPSTPFIRWIAQRSVGLFCTGISPVRLRFPSPQSDGDLAELSRDRLRRQAWRKPPTGESRRVEAPAAPYGEVTRRDMPDYLREKSYTTLRHAAKRVVTRSTPIIAYLHRQPRAGMDRFVLRNVQDGMPSSDVADLWFQIARVGRPGSRIIFYTESRRSPLECQLPAPLYQRFNYHRSQSRRLQDRRPAGPCAVLHLYSLAPKRDGSV